MLKAEYRLVCRDRTPVSLRHKRAATTDRIFSTNFHPVVKDWGKKQETEESFPRWYKPERVYCVKSMKLFSNPYALQKNISSVNIRGRGSKSNSSKVRSEESL